MRSEERQVTLTMTFGEFNRVFGVVRDAKLRNERGDVRIGKQVREMRQPMLDSAFDSLVEAFRAWIPEGEEFTL